jgi:hypothetical protein
MLDMVLPAVSVARGKQVVQFIVGRAWHRISQQ